MNPIPTRFPLQWPTGWKRTAPAARIGAQFKRYGRRLTVSEGVERVLQELAHLHVQQDDVIVSTNLQTRLDGMPRGNQGEPGDPGVCVYWRTGPEAPMRCMPLDRYDKVADNLAAVAATLGAFRSIERHGGSAVLDRAFTGFAQLPPPPPGRRDWWTVLGLTPDASSTAISEAHRRLSRQHHPDRGGNADRMAEINRARDEGLQGSGR